MRKPDFCLFKNKSADQLCSNCTADQHLCFCYTDSTITLLLKPKFQASSLLGPFVSELVGNPEALFSHVKAHIYVARTQESTEQRWNLVFLYNRSISMVFF